MTLQPDVWTDGRTAGRTDGRGYHNIPAFSSFFFFFFGGGGGRGGGQWEDGGVGRWGYLVSFHLLLLRPGYIFDYFISFNMSMHLLPFINRCHAEHGYTLPLQTV